MQFNKVEFISAIIAKSIFIRCKKRIAERKEIVNFGFISVKVVFV